MCIAVEGSVLGIEAALVGHKTALGEMDSVCTEKGYQCGMSKPPASHLVFFIGRAVGIFVIEYGKIVKSVKVKCLNRLDVENDIVIL